MERFGGRRWGAPSSGNHAFDEYRTETLRRLEEEQREFRDFLDRLRFAKDKAEFDQFMAERRNRPDAAKLRSRRADLPRSPAFSGPFAERRAARCFSGLRWKDRALQPGKLQEVAVERDPLAAPFDRKRRVPGVGRIGPARAGFDAKRRKISQCRSPGSTT